MRSIIQKDDCGECFGSIQSKKFNGSSFDGENVSEGKRCETEEEGGKEEFFGGWGMFGELNEREGDKIGGKYGRFKSVPEKDNSEPSFDSALRVKSEELKENQVMKE